MVREYAQAPPGVKSSVAFSRHLAVSQEVLADLPGRVLWFKGQIQPEAVLEMLESIPDG